MPENSFQTIDSLRAWYDSLRLKGGVLLGVAALSGIAATANTRAAEAANQAPAALTGSAKQAEVAPTVPDFGYDTNKIWVDDPGAALAEAKTVAQEGDQEIRILTPYTVGGAEFNNDLNRYCNALFATEKYGLKLEIGLDGHFKDGSWGYFPDSANEMQKLHTGLFNLMSHFANGTCHDDKGNPIKADELNIGFNEPNYKGRYKMPNMAANLANLLVYLAPLLRQDAENLHIRFNLTAAAVTLSDQNAPTQFIKDFDTQLQAKLQPGDPMPFDNIQMNYYAYGQFTADNLGSVSHATSIVNAVDEIRRDFGSNIPVGLSEVGAFSSTPKEKELLYSNPVPATVTTFDGSKQGHFYERVINLAACEGLSEVEIFHQSDDGGDVLRTGTMFPDGTPKPSDVIVTRAESNVKLGKINC